MWKLFVEGMRQIFRMLLAAVHAGQVHDVCATPVPDLKAKLYGRFKKIKLAKKTWRAKWIASFGKQLWKTNFESSVENTSGKET